MSKSNHTIDSRYFSWNLFRRGPVYYADGRNNQPNLGKHSLGTKVHAEALQALKSLDHRMAVKHGLISEPIAGGCDNNAQPLLITEIWTRYLALAARPLVLGGCSPSTQKKYRAGQDKHLRFCAERNITSWRQINEKSLVAYGEWLKAKKYGDASIYFELVLVKQVVRWLIDVEKALPATCRVHLKVYRSNESTTYCYTRAEVAAMIEHCRAQPRLGWLATVIVGLSSTGMRIAELADLRWNDVDLSSGMITIPDNRHTREAQAGQLRTTKAGRSRRVPIHPALLPELLTIPQPHTGHVFRGPRGGHLKPDVVRVTFIEKVLAPLSNRFPADANQSGFRDGRLHSFRHFFISQAFISGVSEGEIREWVGHADSRIIERYRHLGTDDAQRKMAKISFAAEPATPPTPAPASTIAAAPVAATAATAVAPQQQQDQQQPGRPRPRRAFRRSTVRPLTARYQRARTR